MELLTILKKKFGHDAFRPGQEKVIRDVISGNDTIAILPTGMGKSLCYQLPGYMSNGTVLIISPLVALMEDQVAIMKKNGEKRVVALNSFLSYEEKKHIIGQLSLYKFIFVSPEMFAQKNVFEAFQRIQLSLLVMDEAHCISQWGFDFRPDYLRIGERFSGNHRPTVLALTATADDQVIDDIRTYLQLKNPVLHRYSVDRPNISYAFIKTESEAEKMKWLKRRVGQTIGPGIIYVATRKRADEIASLLQEDGISIASYHAGKDQEDRAFIQEQFIIGEIQWICSTNAFGMGIHKDDIRQVIHAYIPQSITGYIQEVGRAGRDGKRSAATLLFTPEDEGRTRYIILDDIPKEAEIQHYISLLSQKVLASEAASVSGMSGTGKRIVEYYMERMSLDEIIAQMNALIREKETQLQKIIRLIHSAQCIREEILSFFDEECHQKPIFCCSNCVPLDQSWLLKQSEDVFDKKPLDWQERLAGLLG